MTPSKPSIDLGLILQIFFSNVDFKLKGLSARTTPLFLYNLIYGPVEISLFGVKFPSGRCSVIIKYLYLPLIDFKNLFIESLERCCRTCLKKHISPDGNGSFVISKVLKSTLRFYILFYSK